MLCFGHCLLQEDSSLKFDWDDTEGNTKRRLAGLALEKNRQAEMRRKRLESRGLSEDKSKNIAASNSEWKIDMTGRKKH